MDKNYEVYLAGRISGLSYDEALKDREKISEMLLKEGIRTLNPMRGKKFLSGVKNISDHENVNHQMPEIIGRDLNDVNRSDCVLVLTGDSCSWGTSGEFWYATWIAKKPTLVIATNVPGWLGYYATRIVPSMEEAVVVLKDWKRYWNGEGIYETR